VWLKVTIRSQISGGKLLQNSEVERRMLAGYNVRVFNKVDAIGKDPIDAISDDPFFTYGWFKTLETSKPIKSDPLYLTVYDGSSLVAFLPCFIDSVYPYFVYRPYLPFMKRIFKMGNGLSLWRDHVLMCYSPFSWRSTILLRSNSNRGLILSLVSGKVDDICRENRILFSSFEFLSEDDRLLMSHLQNNGYLNFPWWENSLFLDIEWSNFEDYLASLKHKTRLNVRREIKKFKESGITVDELSEFGDLAATLSNLNSNLFSKYNKHKESPYDDSFFKRLNEFARDKSKLFIAKKDREVVGFCLSLRQGDVLDCYMCGFNYDVQTNTDFIYFNLVYYEPLKWAIKERIKRIHYRISAEEAKLRRGCKPAQIFSFVKCHNKLLDIFFSLHAKMKYQK